MGRFGRGVSGVHARSLGRHSGLEDLSLGNPDQPCHVQAVVSWFAPTNFLKMDAQLSALGFPPPPDQRHNDANSPESLLLGQRITEIRIGWKRPTLKPMCAPTRRPSCCSTGPKTEIVQ